MAVKDKKLMRLPKRGQIAGVCAGLAQYFEVDVTLVRVAFVILTFATSGGMLLGYIVLALIMPKPEETVTTAALKTDSPRASISKNAEELADEFRVDDRARTLRNLFGIGLIVFGLWLLLAQFVPDWTFFSWDFIWPIALVLLGIAMLNKSRR